MRTKLFLLLAPLLLQPVVSAADELEGFTFDIHLGTGGFYLEGEKGGRELSNTGIGDRDKNETSATLIGAGVWIGYGIRERLQLFLNSEYQYAPAESEDYYALVMYDLGAKYRLRPGHSLAPYALGALTRYTVQDLKVYDEALETTSPFATIREYDFSGRGITLGLGVDMVISDALTYNVEYSRTLSSLSAEEGNVEFDNNPSLSRLTFGAKFSF